MAFPASELVLNKEGKVYHLGLSPEQIADTILLVGDQDRVALVSSFFDEIDTRVQHREFVTHTGTYRGKRISVLSTGIGTDNIDIVINELDALVNIDLITRTEAKTPRQLNLLRIGTCGLLQPDIDLHSYVISAYAYGLDNVAHFYKLTFSDEELQLCTALNKHLDLPASIQPYLTAASEQLVDRLSSDQTVKGITVTSSGFYGPQGRQLRIQTHTNALNERLTHFTHPLGRVSNFEMESSALFALGRALGHQCVTICLGVANRPRMEFSKGYHSEMNGLISYVLERI